METSQHICNNDSHPDGVASLGSYIFVLCWYVLLSAATEINNKGLTLIFGTSIIQFLSENLSHLSTQYACLENFHSDQS